MEALVGSDRRGGEKVSARRQIVMVMPSHCTIHGFPKSCRLEWQDLRIHKRLQGCLTSSFCSLASGWGQVVCAAGHDVKFASF